jgi:hypothetical protein
MPAEDERGLTGATLLRPLMAPMALIGEVILVSPSRG